MNCYREERRDLWTRVLEEAELNKSDRRQPPPEWKDLREETRRAPRVSHKNQQSKRATAWKHLKAMCRRTREKKKKKGTPSKQIKYADYMKGNPAELLLIYFFFWVIETQKQDNLRYETQRKKWWANRIPLLSTPVICKNKQNDATPRQVPSSFNDGHLFVFFRKTSI